MNKQQIIAKLITDLEREFQTLAKAAIEAREAATSEEAKPENEYDTRALEASYLAGAQAKRADEIRTNIQRLKLLNPTAYRKDQAIGSTALVEVEMDGSDKRLFFMIPMEGGKSIRVDEKEVIVLSIDSPLAKELMGQKLGHVFSFRTKEHEREYEIIAVS